MQSRVATLFAAAMLFVFVNESHAALSGNLFTNGNFESTANLKSNYTYDSLNNPVGAHRFNQDADWGLWLGRWGLQDLEQNGYYGLGGFSTLDNPRGVGVTMQGVAGVLADDRSNNNRSLDPLNPGSGNHIMETVAFYPSMAQWVKAPANQTTGPMKFSFDFFLNHWTTGNDAVDGFDIRVFGSNTQPDHNVGIGESFFDPTTNATGTLLGAFGWGRNWTNDLGFPESNGWKHLDSAAPSVVWDDVDPADLGNVVIPVNLTQTYQYYSVGVRTWVYGEGHFYFWGVSGYGTVGYDAADQGPAVGFDNIDFRISVTSAVLRGDVNLDGLINALDISPFVQKLTGGIYQAEADINQDSLVNALDISGFVTCLVNGACAGEAGGSAVPEPASLTLLALASLAASRRGVK